MIQTDDSQGIILRLSKVRLLYWGLRLKAEGLWKVLKGSLGSASFRHVRGFVGCGAWTKACRGRIPNLNMAGRVRALRRPRTQNCKTRRWLLRVCKHLLCAWGVIDFLAPFRSSLWKQCSQCIEVAPATLRPAGSTFAVSSFHVDGPRSYCLNLEPL